MNKKIGPNPFDFKDSAHFLCQSQEYALLSSIMVLIPKFLAGFAGVAVNALGYSGFFLFTALLGLPVVFLIARLAKSLPDFDAQRLP